MSSEWRPFKLTEVGRIVTGKTPLGGQPEFFNGQVPFVTPPDFVGQKWIAGTARTVSELGAQSVKGSIIPPGSVLVTCIGSDMGKAAIASARCLTNQQINAVVVDETKFLPEFLFYNLALRKTEFRGIAGGSAQPILNKTAFGAIQVFFPSRGEQSRVVALLRPLDDRIALLRETNATLEAIAQALFKSWFVDFDPVHAKQQGIAPAGMDEATAALFPDSFESALELMPKGWCPTTLADAFEINPARGLKRGSIARYSDMASLATIGHSVEAPVEREMGSGSKFRNGDTLLARITPCLENGKSAYVDFLASDQVGWGSTEFVVLRPRAPLPEYLGYLLCRHPPFREYAIRSMSGTSGRQRIQNDLLGRYPLAIPNREVAEAFAATCVPIQQAIASNHEHAQTLAALRDTLLPRLISGQLRLPEAESQLADAIA